MRKIFIVIERRADYTRYKPILTRLSRDPFFKIHLVVTGICLLDKHGRDIDNIKKDGFSINTKIDMFSKKSRDYGGEMVKAMGKFMRKIVDELDKAKPDIVLTGFDIGANFATAVAGAHMNIPVAHIQGGEISGSIDESLRHAMSKFSHIHFPATQLSKKRLIRMGENPRNIFVVGCPSIDNLINTPHITKEKIAMEFGIDFAKHLILIIQHPVTTESQNSYQQIEETLNAVKNLGLQTIILYPNNDAGYSRIINKINISGIKYFTTLPNNKFVNLLRYSSLLIGNSSSGIHEAATFKIPVVNIGTRQQGRERAENVIDARYNQVDISKAIRKALFDKKFRQELKKVKNPYGDGKSAKKIVAILQKITLDGIIQKRFYEPNLK